MTETTTLRAQPRRASARRIILLLLAGGLVAALFAFGCQSESGDSEEEAFHEGNTEVLLNIGVRRSDDLPDSLERPVIDVPGYDQWEASLRYGGTSKAFGDFSVGETHSFTVYPQGRGGPAIEVPFTMKKTMMSGTAQAKTWVTVYSDSIVAEGPAISEERASFAW